MRTDFKTVAVPREVHRALKVYCIENDLNIMGVIGEAILSWLQVRKVERAYADPSSGAAANAIGSELVVGSRRPASTAVTSNAMHRPVATAGGTGNLPTQLHGAALGSDALDEDVS